VQWVSGSSRPLNGYIFSSTALEGFLASRGLPTIPLLPVSGSQAVIGSVLGIGLLQGVKGVRQIRWGVLGGIASGWITTPLIAAVIGFVLLFVVQNVFGQQVYVPLAALPDGAPQAFLSAPFSLPARWSAGPLRSPSLHPVL
jgi:phosphotransferase system  glucose/maltose/N-acetylglucosamine-specific IIC component